MSEANYLKDKHGTPSYFAILDNASQKIFIQRSPQCCFVRQLYILIKILCVQNIGSVITKITINFIRI